MTDRFLIAAVNQTEWLVPDKSSISTMGGVAIDIVNVVVETINLLASNPSVKFFG